MDCRGSFTISPHSPLAVGALFQQAGCEAMGENANDAPEFLASPANAVAIPPQFPVFLSWLKGFLGRSWGRWW